MRHHVHARHWLRGAALLGILGGLLVTLMAGSASAALTTPGNGATVRGTVFVHEGSGGQDNCVFGNSGDDTLIEISGPGYFQQFFKGDGGSYGINWATVNARVNGGYTIRSYGRNITNGFFRCNTSGYNLLSAISVTVQNRSFLSYTGSTGGLTGNVVTLQARVTLEDGASNVGGRPVSFTLGSQSASATTDGAGFATANLTLNQPAGSYTVSASYGGDAFFTGSSASAGFSIGVRPTTLTYLGDTSGFWTETGTLRARLNDQLTGAPVGGKSISFSLGSFSGSATTDGSGVATITTALSQTPGSYTASANWAGDGFYGGRSVAAGFTILKRPTALSYTGDTSGFWDEDATVSARLTDVRNGAGVANKTLTFTLGSQTVTAVTDSAGNASATVHLTQPAGVYPTGVSFAGDANYVGSSAASAFTTLVRPTTLTYGGDTDGFWLEDATVTATLTDDRRSGAGVAGKTITFTLGSKTVTATTGADGAASATVNLSDDPGAYTAGSAFADDGNYGTSSDADAFAILKRPTILTYNGAVQGFRGHTVTLAATLTDQRSGDGVGGKVVEFTLGSFSASDTTDADGNASVEATLNQAPGSYTVDVAYDEDGHYLGSTDTDPFTLDWEYVFPDARGTGTVNINVSTREWQFVSGADDTGIVSDPSMTVLKAPANFVPPTPPCDPADPQSCGVPSPPCDPNDPAGCLPEPPPPPCDTNDPTTCAPEPPTVPECVDDPAGGDPVCPKDYLPSTQSARSSDPVCVDNPMGGDPICLPPLPEPPAAPCDPNDPASCVPDLPEPPEPPCDPNDPASCGVPTPPPPPCSSAEDCANLALCGIPQTTGCADRFVLLAFHGPKTGAGDVTIAGLFDLQTGVFASPVRTDIGVYVLQSLVANPDVPELPEPPEAPELPCDPNGDPTACVPPAPEPPTVPEVPPAPEPPTVPCDPTVDPTACVPPPPGASSRLA